MVRKLLLINLQALFSAMFMRNAIFQRGVRRFGAGKTTLIKLGITLLMLYVLGAVAITVGALFTQLIAFYQLGIGWMYFAICGLMVFSICVITCIFTAQAQIFNAKDNDLLLSKPIKPSSILLARILTLLVLEYVFVAVLSLPALFIWITGGYASALGIVFFTIGFLLLPLLALAVSCMLAWILTLVTSRMRKKNIVTLLISLAFLGAYFFVVSNMQQYIAELIANGAELAAAWARGFPPLFYFGSAITEGRITDLLIFAACAVVPFAVMIMLLSKNFIKVATTKRGAKRITYREGTLKASGHIKAINKNELRHYWSNPMVVMNTSLGGVFAIIVGGYVLFARESAMALLSQVGITGSQAVYIGAALALTASMNTLSASLISLEGKRLWIVRSMPVRACDVLLGKLITHLEISALPTLLGSLLCIIALIPVDLGFDGAVVLLLLPQVFIFATGAFGLILNLHMPKFNWLNELQPVKQSLPVVLVMFGTMAVLAGIAMLYIFALKNLIGIAIFALLLILMFAVIDALLLRWINTRGAAVFDGLDA